MTYVKEYEIYESRLLVDIIFNGTIGILTLALVRKLIIFIKKKRKISNLAKIETDPEKRKMLIKRLNYLNNKELNLINKFKKLNLKNKNKELDKRQLKKFNKLKNKYNTLLNDMPSLHDHLDYVDPNKTYDNEYNFRI